MQPILEAKIILKKMVHKTMLYFNQCPNILEKQDLAVVAISVRRNQKDCLMKKLVLLLDLHIHNSRIILGQR